MSVKHECCCGGGVKKEADKSAPIGSRLALPTPGDGRTVEGRACETQGSIFSGIFVRFSIFLGVKFWQKFPEKKVMRYSRHLPSPTATPHNVSSHLKFQEFRRKGLSQLSSYFLACSYIARLRSEHATVVSDASDRLEKSLHLQY